MRVKFLFLICLICTSPMAWTADTLPSANSKMFPASTDWPWWRGPDRNGIASADQQLPLEWSDSKNVLWKSPVPGRGHGSPTVVGTQVFLATADEVKGVQSVLCFDRSSGRQLWNTDVHKGGLMTKKGNKKATQASASVACDGKRLFINFLNGGAVYTTALTREGKQIWQTKITDYVVHQGFGSSPAIYKSLVLVSADNKGGGALAGLERETGKIVWKHSRPKKPNYASPIVLRVNDRDQLLFTGCNLVSSYDPSSGEKLWEVKGREDRVRDINSDGWEGSSLQAAATRRITWQRSVPMALAEGGMGKWNASLCSFYARLEWTHLRAVTDAGVASCWRSDTGKLVWKGRLGGTFSSSPVMVGIVHPDTERER